MIFSCYRAAHTMEEARKSRPIRVLVIDDDAGVRDVVPAILGDEGYDVSMLDHLADAAVRAAIDRIEPNCILLDGAEAIGYAKAWTTAADMRRRARPIPTVMFTAHVLDAAEAERATSERAVAAGFAAVLCKPFHLEDLVSMVERVVAAAQPSDGRPQR